jgi:hypothetical protein
LSQRMLGAGIKPAGAETAAGCKREPVARISQTPAAKITSNRKYGK